MSTCPRCGNRNEISAASCEVCGLNLRGGATHIPLALVTCPNCGRSNLDTAVYCDACNAPIRREAHRIRARRARDLIVTTTYSVEGRTITQYLDIVTAEVVIGTGLLAELRGDVADLAGVRSGGFQEKLQEAKRMALEELRHAAVEIGADAVVGVDLDYMTMTRNLLMVTASGTAVNLSSMEAEAEHSEGNHA